MIRPNLSIEKTNNPLLFNCQECESVLTVKDSLIRHQKSKHEGVKYSCNQCQYKVSDKSNQIRHQKSKHEGITYTCNQCQFQATRQDHFRE